MDNPSSLSPKEGEEILVIMNKLTDKQLVDILTELAIREKSLLNSQIGQDLELREVTLWNIAVLCAAAERITMSTETE